MTKINRRIDQTFNWPKIVINGREVVHNTCIERIEGGNGNWTGETNCGDEFQIIGGRAAGGASNEWLVYYPVGYGDQWVSVRSAAEAIRFIQNV